MTRIQKNKSELIAENMHYVELVAKQYLNQGLTLEQLIDAGNKGLMEADEHFDPNKGFAFMSYAVWWIRQSILEALAATARRESIPQDIELSARESGILRDIADGESLEQIAEERGLTVERVKQIKAKAQRKLNQINNKNSEQ